MESVVLYDHQVIVSRETLAAMQALLRLSGDINRLTSGQFHELMEVLG